MFELDRNGGLLLEAGELQIIAIHAKIAQIVHWLDASARSHFHYGVKGNGRVDGVLEVFAQAFAVCVRHEEVIFVDLTRGLACQIRESGHIAVLIGQ